MKEPNKEIVFNISLTKVIAACKMASGPPAKAKETTEAEPQFISDKKYRVTVESTFHCSETGIKFEVKSRTVIKYSLEYGSDYRSLIQENRYELLGPIFNVEVISGRVSTVYLPHYVCLEGFKDKSTIKFGHFKDGKVTLKTPSDVDPSYVVLKDPTFSCVASIGEFSTFFLRRKKPFPFIGQVLVYFRVVCAEDDKFTEYRIHLYLVPTDRPHLKTLDDKKRLEGFKRINKPPQTETVNRKVNYIISGDPKLSVWPKTLQFLVHKEIESCPFTEINISQDAPEIVLLVKAEGASEPVWTGRLTKADIKELSAQPVQRGVCSEHFVDKHRSHLIERVENIRPVLDDLRKQKLLTEEECSKVMSNSTPQEKMRVLFRSVQYWGHEDKDTFHQAVKKHNQPILKGMEQGD